MKKLLLASILLSFFVLNAQQKKDQRLIEKQYTITRVPLKEKFNLPARELPSLIIQAFCEGKINGYYPLKPTEVCSYHEFAAHFTVNKFQPSRNDDAYEEVNCQQAFCYTKNEASIEPFRLYYDILEEKSFSRENSSQQHRVKFIRLIYSYEKYGMELFFDGPLFSYSDLIKLEPEEYALNNPKNDAAKISFKQYFEKRMFTGFPLKSGSERTKGDNPNTEKDKWQH